MRPLYFVSGASAPADIRGLARFSVPLGVSLAELSKVGLKVLCEHARMPLVRIFVDSGAFAEVDRTGAVVRPIPDAVWVERVRVMHGLAAVFGPLSPLGDYGPRLYVVAPDKVGDQPETLRRLALHAEAMRACMALGARVVVPIQRGAMTAEDFDVACCEALGRADFVRGIPGNKVAMPPEELEGFLRARRPSALHFLGVGPRGPSYGPLTALVDRVLGDAEVSCDSNALAASAGRTNGRDGGPRLLTALQDLTREAAPWTSTQRAPRELAVSLAFSPMRMHELVVEDLVRRGVARAPTREPVQMDLFDRVIR